MSVHSVSTPCRFSPAKPVTLPAARPTPILIPCPHCEDGTRWKSRYGGNDPDVWAVRCEECEGEGEVAAGCECCPALATEVFDDQDDRPFVEAQEEYHRTYRDLENAINADRPTCDAALKAYEDASTALRKARAERRRMTLCAVCADEQRHDAAREMTDAG